MFRAGVSANGAATCRQADALFRQGEERGDRQALLNAVEMIDARSRIRAHKRRSTGRRRNSLGNALETLGEWGSGRAARGSGRSLSRRAGGTHARSGSARLGDDADNLGFALMRLGERESGTARLEEAVAVYGHALEERTRKRVPLDWARTRTNLVLRSGDLVSGKAGLRGSRRRLPPIGRRRRRGHGSEFHSDGRRPRKIWYRPRIARRARERGGAARGGRRSLAPRWRKHARSGSARLGET